MFDYIQLFLSAGLEECFGFTPCHQLLSQARRNIKAASKEKATVGVGVVVVGVGLGGGGGCKGHVSLDRAEGRRACHMADG